MARFTVTVNRGGDHYLREVARRLKAQNGFGVLLDGQVRREGRAYHFNVVPNLPKLHYLGFVLLAGALVLNRLLSWGNVSLILLMLPGALVSSAGVFWSPIPYAYAVRKGLRKHGYDGTIGIRWS